MNGLPNNSDNNEWAPTFGSPSSSHTKEIITKPKDSFDTLNRIRPHSIRSSNIRFAIIKFIKISTLYNVGYYTI